MTHRCCSEEGLQRSVAVEVKSMATDAGRAKFVQLLRYSKTCLCMTGLACKGLLPEQHSYCVFAP